MRARRLISEVMLDFRSSTLDVAPHRFRVLCIPPDFDADDKYPTSTSPASCTPPGPANISAYGPSRPSSSWSPVEVEAASAAFCSARPAIGLCSMPIARSWSCTPTKRAGRNLPDRRRPATRQPTLAAGGASTDPSIVRSTTPARLCPRRAAESEAAENLQPPGRPTISRDGPCSTWCGCTASTRSAGCRARSAHPWTPMARVESSCPGRRYR
ncbi:hypothetical protein DFR70_12726 [Nocardia tenerifensis]|uniref:Uncharacterized protein n=1 Tax=Nocardia tenerifensis TaxID=228006 RepID=A0A318K0W6_9NOCA|nr:hypothetical protein DFR70_12726 [Nocardia tenerifensis]